MSGAMGAPPRARLLCRTGELAGQSHELTRSNLIGRNSDNDVVLHSSLISGRHARIWEKDGAFFVEDLGSSNGTWVDGLRISDPVRLDRLNVITFAGTFDFVFARPETGAETAEEESPGVEPEKAGAATVELRPDESAPAPPSEDDQRTRLDMGFQPLPELEETGEPGEAAREAEAGAGEAASPPSDDPQHTRLDMDFQPLPELEEKGAEPPAVEPPAAQAPTPETPDPDEAGRTRMDMTGFGALPDLEAGETTGYRLEVTLPDDRLQIFEVQRGRYTLGRSADCDITLDEPSISRHHATLTVGEALVLEDADSVNGTLVDGSEIDEVELSPNQIFSLGPFVEVKVTKR